MIIRFLRGDFVNFSEKPIGFFDSGVGGLSVLREAIKLMPEENYIYFGDSKNAPYGPKNVEEVRSLTLEAIEFLVQKDCKAIVVACNTATSAAIEDIRRKYKNIPVIGIEPALKPAVEMGRKGKIIIMATAVTLMEAKFNSLMKNYNGYADIEPLVCGELVEFVEQGILEGVELRDYLKTKLKPYLHKDIAAVVLGCTHFPFVKREIKRVIKGDVPIIDGSIGTVIHLKNQLDRCQMKNENIKNGIIEIYNSSDRKELIDLSYELIEF